jgi:hypothetical protein
VVEHEQTDRRRPVHRVSKALQRSSRMVVRAAAGEPPPFLATFLLANRLPAAAHLDLLRASSAS